MSDFVSDVHLYCEKFHHFDTHEQKVENLFALMREQNKEDACVCIITLINNGLESEAIQLLKCVQSMHPTFELSSSLYFGKLLQAASTSKNPIIQCLLLKPYGDDKLVNQSFSDDILKEAIEWIRSDNLELSEVSSQVTLNLFTSMPSLLPNGLALIVEAGKGVTFDSILILRYCQILSRLCRAGDYCFQNVLDSGGVQLILDQCRSPDVLVAILAVEFLSDFAYSAKGLIFLVEHKHVSWLMQLACGSDSNSDPDPLLGGQALRTLAVILERASNLTVQIWDVEEGFGGDRLGPAFVRAILRHVESSDEASLLIGLQALSSFASSSPSACRVVLLDRTLKDSWLSLLSRKIELQSAALHTVAKVLTCGQAENIESGISLTDLKRDLFSHVGMFRNQATLPYLLKLAREPVLPLKYAAYDVLRSLATLGWGLELLMAPCGGSDEPWVFIKDVSTEYDKKGKEWKFSVIEAISQCPGMALLNEDIKSDVREILLRGPFFAHARFAELKTLEL